MTANLAKQIENALEITAPPEEQLAARIESVITNLGDTVQLARALVETADSATERRRITKSISEVENLSRWLAEQANMLAEMGGNQ